MILKTKSFIFFAIFLTSSVLLNAEGSHFIFNSNVVEKRKTLQQELKILDEKVVKLFNLEKELNNKQLLNKHEISEKQAEQKELLSQIKFYDIKKLSIDYLNEHINIELLKSKSFEKQLNNFSFYDTKYNNLFNFYMNENQDGMTKCLKFEKSFNFKVSQDYRDLESTKQIKDTFLYFENLIYYTNIKIRKLDRGDYYDRYDELPSKAILKEFVNYINSKQKELISFLYTQFYELAFLKHRNISFLFGLNIYLNSDKNLIIEYYGIDSEQNYKTDHIYIPAESIGKDIKNNLVMKTVYTANRKEPTNVIMTYQNYEYWLPVTLFANHTSAQIIKNELDFWIFKNNISPARSFIREQYIQLFKNKVED